MVFTSKNLQNCDKPYFHDEEYQKNNEPHISSQFWDINLNVMIFTTNYCSKSMENVPGDSIDHIESP